VRPRSRRCGSGLGRIRGAHWSLRFRLLKHLSIKESRCARRVAAFDQLGKLGTTDLFENQLDGYAWNGIDDGEKAYDEAKKQKKSFIDLYDHTHIEDNVGEFLDYFVTRKVMSGDEFILKTCPRVIRKLLKWMRDKKLVDLTNDDIKAMCENQLWEDTMRGMGF
jgi:hypothetical protein